MTQTRDPSLLEKPDIQPKEIRRIGFKTTAKYMLLPGIIPLLRQFGGRMGQFMYMFTAIFGAIGLIDKNHPCLRVENAGRYRFVDVVGLAASNLRMSRDNIPQILMFFGTMLAIILMAIVSIMTVIKGVFGAEAHAQLFSNPTSVPANQDWAFLFLDRMFGATGMGVWTGSDKDMAFYTTMLKRMMVTYSTALMVIAVIMIVYIMVISLVESARTGKPFGDKFDSVWGPIRLVIAIGFLVPISNGYNGAQLLTFHVSQWGSSLATNVWVSAMNFGDTSRGTPRPSMTPTSVRGLKDAFGLEDNYRFLRAYFLIQLCMQGWNEYARDSNIVGNKTKVIPRFSSPSDQNGQYINIQFGTFWDKDFCGAIRVPTLSNAEYGGGWFNTTADQMEDMFETGSNMTQIKETFESKSPEPTETMKAQDLINNFSKFLRVAHMMNTVGMTNLLKQPVAKIVEKYKSGQCVMMDIPEINTPLLHGPMVNMYFRSFGQKRDDITKERKFFVYDSTIPNNFMIYLDNAVNRSMVDSATNGWSSAGAYMFKITNTVSRLSEIMNAKPVAYKSPKLFASRFAYPGISDSDLAVQTQADIHDSNLNTRYAGSVKLFIMLNDANRWFKDAPAMQSADVRRGFDYDTVFLSQMTDSAEGGRSGISTEDNFIETLAPFYLKGIKIIPNDTFDPITKLVLMGDNFIDTFVQYKLASMGLSIAGPLLALFGGGIGAGLAAGANVIGSLLSIVAPFYLLAGLVLKIWFPLQPFMFFMFGVVEWMVSILEAVIGMPLWALSFVSAQGKGIFGGNSAQGALALFEIMLRPTILIFSFISVLLMFYATITFINSCFAIFLDNYVQYASADSNTPVTLSDMNKTWSIDVTSSLFCLIYVFTVYNTGNSLFKLINILPNQFMRWYQNIKGFGSEIDIKSTFGNSFFLQQKAGELMQGLSDSKGASDAGEMLGNKLAGSKLGGAISKINIGSLISKIKSDARLKDNVEFFGSVNGVNVYKFSYIGAETMYLGVMAQEVLLQYPDAVVLDRDGYYAVDYDMIGIPFMEYSAENETVLSDAYGVGRG